MLKKILAAGTLLAAALSAGPAAVAQEVTLRLHQFLPAQSTVPANFIKPWIEKVEQESGGRIKIEHYPAMQLGGTPAALYDQVRDGVVDIVWTLPGYTPGRFPKTEAFELPFMVPSGEVGAQAFYEYYERNLQDTFADVHILAVHVHSPGLLHVKGEGVRALEDMAGLKLRGPTRVINMLLEELGATPVGMPVPQIPEALSKGVIDGTVVPWEVTTALRIAELVDTHTGFSGKEGLYTATFIFAMNKAKYESLPDDLKKVIDANSGIETSRWMGRTQDLGDKPGRDAAVARNNEIVILDEAETQRWKDKAQVVTRRWIEEMTGKGIDGAALVQQAKDLIAKYSGQ